MTIRYMISDFSLFDNRRNLITLQFVGLSSHQPNLWRVRRKRVVSCIMMRIYHYKLKCAKTSFSLLISTMFTPSHQHQIFMNDRCERCNVGENKWLGVYG